MGAAEQGPFLVRTTRCLGASLLGAGAELVTIEARFDPHDRDRTEVILTGLPDSVLRESRGRIESALAANGLALGQGRLYLNLVPAARRKSGETLDLALALAAAAAAGHFDPRALKATLFLGEMGIDGRLHAVPGGLAAALTAREQGVARLIAPVATANEAACIGELEVYGARTLAQVVAHLTDPERALERVRARPEDLELTAETAPTSGPSLDDVRGQAQGKLALAVAAAGGHGLLLVGPPGTGKSMLARRLVRLLPFPRLDERFEITRVLSAAGRWPGGLARERPFRAPHHTTSTAGLAGGGPQCTPGEVTLAHCGVLFLDELPEFRREALEVLRQPLESGVVSIARATRKVEYPARFQFVAAMNPCPCGYRGHPRVPCTCPASAVQRYRQRISGPLLDRVDLCVEITPSALSDLMPTPTVGQHEPPVSGVEVRDGAREIETTATSRAGGSTPSTATSPRDPDTSESALRLRVARARSRASARQGSTRNTDLSANELDAHAPLDRESRSILARATRQRSLSTRAVQSLRRVARTLADLDGEAVVAPEHILRALGLRAPLA